VEVFQHVLAKLKVYVHHPGLANLTAHSCCLLRLFKLMHLYSPAAC